MDNSHLMYLVVYRESVSVVPQEQSVHLPVMQAQHFTVQGYRPVLFTDDPM